MVRSTILSIIYIYINYIDITLVPLFFVVLSSNDDICWSPPIPSKLIDYYMLCIWAEIP